MLRMLSAVLAVTVAAAPARADLLLAVGHLGGDEARLEQAVIDGGVTLRLTRLDRGKPTRAVDIPLPDAGPQFAVARAAVFTFDQGKAGAVKVTVKP